MNTSRLSKIAITFTVVSITSCAGLKSADEVRVGDNNLSCSQLRDEIRSWDSEQEGANTHAVAGIGSGVAAGVVGMAMLFPPMIVPIAAAGGTGYGALKARDASVARNRKQHLTTLYNNKGCSGAATGAVNQDTGMNEEVRLVQKELNMRGYKAGPEDGVLGKQTKAALRTYQENNGLEVNGKLDAETKKALLGAL